MGLTWYLGNDMIFFIVGLLLLPFYHMNKVLGWAVAWILMLASTATMAYLTALHHLAPEALDGHHQRDYFYWAYTKPSTQVPAYLVGVMAAWILLRMEEGRRREDWNVRTGRCDCAVVLRDRFANLHRGHSSDGSR